VLRSHHFSAILTASPATYAWAAADFLKLLKQAAEQAQLTPVGELAFTFPEQGISAVVLLEESHVALHFWPEQGKVSVDIHVCDYEQDNLGKAEVLAEVLALQISGDRGHEQWHNLSVTR